MSKLPTRIRYAGQMYRIAIDPELQRHVERAIDKKKDDEGEKPIPGSPEAAQEAEPDVEGIELPPIGDAMREVHVQERLNEYLEPTLDDALAEMKKRGVQNSGSEQNLLNADAEGLEWTFSVNYGGVTSLGGTNTTLMMAYALPMEEGNWYEQLADKMRRGLKFVAKGFDLDHIIFTLCGQNFGAEWDTELGKGLLGTVAFLQKGNIDFRPVKKIEIPKKDWSKDQLTEWAKEELLEIYKNAEDLATTHKINDWTNKANVLRGLERLRDNGRLAEKTFQGIRKVINSFDTTDEFEQFMAEVMEPAKGGQVTTLQSIIEKDVRKLTQGVGVKGQNYSGPIEVYEDAEAGMAIAKVKAPYQMIYVYEGSGARPKLKEAAMTICNKDLIISGNNRNDIKKLLNANVILGTASKASVSPKTSGRDTADARKKEMAEKLVDMLDKQEQEGAPPETVTKPGEEGGEAPPVFEEPKKEKEEK